MLSRQVIREANRLWDAIGTQRLDNRNGLIQAQPVSHRHEDGLRVSRLAVGNSDPLSVMENGDLYASERWMIRSDDHARCYLQCVV